MSSKIKVDTIENVAGSGNVSLGSGHNLVVPGNITGQGTAAITSNATVGGTLAVTGATTLSNTLSVPLANSNNPSIRLESPTTDVDFAISSYNDANGTYVSLGANHYLNSGGNDAVFDTNKKSAGILLDARNNGRIQFLTANTGVATSRMEINKDGHITMPNQPAFMAHKNGNQALTAHTLTKITSWTENTDQSNSWDNTNATFTAPTAGIYLFGILMQANINGGLHCMIRKNGNNGAYGDNYLDGGDISGGSYTLLMAMAANDYVEYLAYLTANGNITSGRSKAWAVKVG